MKFHKKLWMSFRKRLYLFLNKRYYIKHVHGVTYLLDMRNRVDRHMDAFSSYEKKQLEFLFSKLKEMNCDCFIDIGSHWGLYSLSFAKQVCFKDAEIYAFEPDKVNRYQLYANLFLNRLQDRIQVYDYAISSRETELKFHQYSENNRGRSSVADDGESVVLAKRLDQLVNVQSKTVGIKIDVEGHELEVVAGMKEMLKKNTCVIQVESFDETLSDLQELMSGYGYLKIKTIESDHYFTNKK